MDTNKYIPIIGLEIHVELSTKSKMFCQCKADYFGKEPNTHTCPVCLGMPGALPVPNKKAIESCIKIGRALNCSINNLSKFDRKHYFYHDLAKGYQISQYDKPIAYKGNLSVLIKNEWKKFKITRVHLEEDTGKLTHTENESNIDFNRSGVPLVEIVTEPCFHNGEEVKAFLELLQATIRSLGVSNADMEKGEMRIEPNISVQFIEKYPKLPKYKVEVKNINSFRFAQKAIDYEINRHITILEKGEMPRQETRGWDLDNNKTVIQRIKENAKDYRYFPDPDIPPFDFSDIEIEILESEINELPVNRIKRLIKLGVKQDDAIVISFDQVKAKYFDELLALGVEQVQSLANVFINRKISTELSPMEFFSSFIEMQKVVKTDFKELSKIIEVTLKENEKAVSDYQSGVNKNAVGFILGAVMKKLKGKGNPDDIRNELLSVLNKK